MKEKTPIPTNGELPPWTSPFAALKNIHLPSTSDAQGDANSSTQIDSKPAAPKTSRGRIEVIRQTAHRGGKTVTVAMGFADIEQAELKTLAKEIQKSCGAGGTVKKGRIEIQGDQREAVAHILANAGFRPVYAGG
ncbi:MAG: translation initiation factor [Nitrospiraceae bacterium]|nr:MAG: translation initiation factor [Nitrospiraceae bacterium]